MMSSHFQGGHMTLAGISTIIIAFLLFVETPAMASAAASGGEEGTIMNPAVELSSREELVHIAGYGEEKLSKVSIIGKVLCHDACVPNHHHCRPYDILSDQPFPSTATAASNPVSGASVAVFCGETGKSRESWPRGTTDEYGDFLIDLPSHLHAIPNLEEACLLKLLHLPKNSECHPDSRGRRYEEIKLHSIEDDGTRTYAANTIDLTSKTSQTCQKTETNRKERMVHAY